MCGRFTLRTSRDTLGDLFHFAETEQEIQPHYNIAPTQSVATVRAEADGRRHLHFLRWGLIPFWAKDASEGAKTINARSETAATRAAFRQPLRQRRCLVLTDGFYEWKGTKGKKEPYYITMRDGRPFAFAGLWDHWQSPDGPVESCTVLTTSASDALRPLHERMPVILRAADHARWLDLDLHKPEALRPLLVPYADADLIAYPVSKRVNNARNDDPRCIAPIEEERTPLFS
jgi:putative SOS response-associated peptidase YedK